MKLSDLSPGDTIIADGGFTCLQAGEHTVHKDDTGLYIECHDESGKHYLCGQEDTNGELIGLSNARGETHDRHTPAQ